jgi:preprotein translocase subunit SecG
MLAVLLTIHMIACVALVIAVMLQRSEGGALGMGGGGTGGVISGRGAASVLVRTTMGLAAVFFTTSIIMTRLNNEQNAAPSTLERQHPAGQLPDRPARALWLALTTTTTPSTTTHGRLRPAPAPGRSTRWRQPPRQRRRRPRALRPRRRPRRLRPLPPRPLRTRFLPRRRRRKTVDRTTSPPHLAAFGAPSR